MPVVRPLPASDLRYTCKESSFRFKTTASLKPLKSIIGQERAIGAIEMGLRLKKQGYNIFVAGMTGTGKSTVIKTYLEKVIDRSYRPPEWCYVQNFEDDETPVIMEVPAGVGRALKNELAEIIEFLREEIPKVFESDEYEEERKRIVEETEEKQKRLFAELERKALKLGFAVRSSKVGLLIIPIVNGVAIKESDYDALPKKEREEIERKQQDLGPDVSHFVRASKRIQKETRQKLEQLDERISKFCVGEAFSDISEKYAKWVSVREFLKKVEDHIIHNIDEFKQQDKEIIMAQAPLRAEKSFSQYDVNVFVDNDKTKGPPVVIETNPTYPNLMGKIEKRAAFGTYFTDFTMIKAGSLSIANHGYLVVNAVDLLSNVGAWAGLKRVIKFKALQIEDLAETFGYVPSSGLKPDPIPTDVKVIMIGPEWVYDYLYAYDEDFPKLFKVKAHFDQSMGRSPRALLGYASFVRQMTEKEKMRAFDRSGISAMVEFGARMVEDQARLSSRLSEIADTIREADFFAAQNKSALVRRHDVEQALEARVYRTNLIESKIHKMITDGDILVDVRGKKVGQINGLTVYDLGDIRFGKPARITVETYCGAKGVIDIEREAKLSGKIYEKGVMILSGFIGRTFGTDRNLSFSASICFEQSYGEIDGDSASSTELCALLSSLGDRPLEQGIAVTGSVNQKGEIQPIGGVNEKIEGYFAVCRAFGFTGKQGVIIPIQNRRNLMLHHEVIKACRQKKFHIWAVRHLSEALPILTGIPTGRRLRDGSFTPGSLFAKVAQNLAFLSERHQQHDDEEEADDAARSERESDSEKKKEKRGKQMGAGDSRKTLKMRRRKSHSKMKIREKRKAEAKRKERRTVKR